MFGKSDKKVAVKMDYKEQGFSGSSTTVPLTDGKLLDYLKHALENHGELTLTRITDEELHVTTSRTIEYLDAESRIDEIGEVIRDFIKSKAIKMDAHAVLVEGKLKGVFGKSYNASFKRNNLVREGYNEEDIVIKPIQIESYEDFEY